MKNWYKRAKMIKAEAYALYYAYKNPRTPLYAKIIVIIVVAYALSPIDLIPDFIPLIGYLDDLILLPIAINLALKLIPLDIMTDAREKAQLKKIKPKYFLTVAIIITIWLLAIVGVISIIYSVI